MFIVFERMSLLQFQIKMKDLTYKKRKGTKLTWQRFILQNKLKCPVTGLEVAYCKYEKSIHDDSYIYNFYSKNGYLFNIDHIIPLSLGGPKSDINNLQPMVWEYNSKKGNNINLGY